MTEEILKECTVEGNVVKLPPGQLDRDVYLNVKKKLELIGGKWKGGRVEGFVFQENPAELLKQIANGEKRNIKKEFQFFQTPDALADEMVKLAQIKMFSAVLEPSAGQGAIIKAVQRLDPGRNVHYFEPVEVNRTILERDCSPVTYLGQDFLFAPLPELNNRFDRIIANPPFSKNQDIDHIQKMYRILPKGGRLVTLASVHWTFASGKKEKDFRRWLDSAKAEIRDIPAGTFDDTAVAAKLIVLDFFRDKV